MKALEFMESGVFKGEPGAVEEIHDRCGDEDFVGPRDGHDPGCRVDGDASDVITDHLDLSSVHAGSNRQAEVMGRVPDGGGAPNCAFGPVELGEYTVTRGLDQSSPMA